MIVGHECRRLEKRIDDALLSGKAYPREAIFLHKMSTRISEYGKNARLTDKQASYLMNILDRLTPEQTQTTPSVDRESGPTSNRGELNDTRDAGFPETNVPPTSPTHRSKQEEAIPSDSNSFVPPSSKEAESAQIRAEDIQVPKDWISKTLAKAAARREHGELLKKLGRRL